MPEDTTAHGSQRVRAFGPKTKTGCATCKIRRVKCDEGKPTCQRCNRAGLVCDGYQKRTVPTASRLAPRPIATLVGHSVSAAPLIALRPFSGSRAEQRSFYYFSQETIPQVCGIHQSQFWLRYVLQACVHSPAIRHAAIAVGSMHEQLSAGALVKLGPSQHSEAEEFALRQYNAAIHLLLQPISGKNGQINVDVALITCVLFTCFEVIRNQLTAALAHIDGAVKILSELRSQDDASKKRTLTSRSIPYAPLSILSQVFTRLDLQASGWVKERPAKLVHNIRGQNASHSLKIPTDFAGLREAGNALESILSPWLRNWQIATKDGAQRPTKEHLSLVYSKYREKLSQWRTAFDKLYAQLTRHKLPSAATHVICLIQLHYTLMYIHANIDHEAASVNETLWDVYKPEFQLMVKYASGILNLDSSSPDLSKQKKSKPYFSLDIGILAPLSFIASRCRDPQIRRASISLIRNANRKEGFWTSEAAATRAQNIVDIEEAGMDIDALERGAVIPRENRVVGCITVIEGDGTGGGKAVFHYVKPPPDGEEESLEWGIRNDVPAIRPSDMKWFGFSTLEGCGIVQTIYWQRYAKYLQGCP